MDMTLRTLIAVYTELSEEAAGARALAAALNQYEAVRDLLAYAEALEANIATLVPTVPTLTYH
jgi:hypothetical protein